MVAKATIRPAKIPPSVIDMSEKPQIRKAVATPGRIAWDIASPVKLIPRSIKKTPTGQALIERRIEPIRAFCIKWKSTKGARKNAYTSYSLRKRESLIGRRRFRALIHKGLAVRGDIMG